mgnify:CR=1 FL=1
MLQIKEVVNRETDGENGEDDGPLAEVHFWDSRTIDLSGIHDQLERPGVKTIVAALEAAKSSYLKPFLDLSRMINQGREEAVDNLKFLSNLNEPCQRLAAASPEEIPAMLPSILHVSPYRLSCAVAHYGSAASGASTGSPPPPTPSTKF